MVLGCGTPGIKSADSNVRPNIVLITLDTTRADRLGSYGYPAAQTAALDHLANQGIRFEYAYSSIPFTIPAHASLFTGLYPFHTGIRANDAPLRPEFTTLAEQLQANGWYTCASVGAYVTHRSWGFDQGFSEYYDGIPEDGDRNRWHAERPAEAVVDDALDCMAKRPSDEPYFLWVHLFDAHHPYIAHGDGKFADPYDGELAYMDAQVQRLVDSLASDSTLWAVVGDHGEALGEHHESSHGLFVYNSTQHVPFFLSGAGVSSGVVSDPVSTVSLTPTLLYAAGLQVPTGLDGVVLPNAEMSPYMESFQTLQRFGLAPQQAVVKGRWKYIGNPQPELYDMILDPSEIRNVAALYPDIVHDLQSTLLAQRIPPPGESIPFVDPAIADRLAARGYVDAPAPLLPVGAVPGDPKDYTRMFDDLQTADPTDPSQRLRVVSLWAKRLPYSFELRSQELHLLDALGQTDAADAVQAEMTATFGQDARVWISQASRSLARSQPEEALRDVEVALDCDPKNAAAVALKVRLLLVLERDEEAIAYASEVLRQDPENLVLAAILGKLALENEDYGVAFRYLNVAARGPNPEPGARVDLAALLVLQGNSDDALRLLQAEVAESPNDLRAHRLLASLLGQDGLYDLQSVHLEVLAQAHPEDPKATAQYALSLFNAARWTECQQVVDEGLERFPDEPDLLFVYANLLAKSGNVAEGRVVFERANALRGVEKP